MRRISAIVLMFVLAISLIIFKALTKGNLCNSPEKFVYEFLDALSNQESVEELISRYFEPLESSSLVSFADLKEFLRGFESMFKDIELEVSYNEKTSIMTFKYYNGSKLNEIEFEIQRVQDVRSIFGSELESLKNLGIDEIRILKLYPLSENQGSNLKLPLDYILILCKDSKPFFGFFNPPGGG